MKAEVFEVSPVKDFLKDCLEHFEAHGMPHTKVMFDMDGDGNASVEFEGHSGMQLIGIGELIRNFAESQDRDPMDIGLKAGLIARELKKARGEEKGKSKLTIKFNEEAEE